MGLPLSFGGVQLRPIEPQLPPLEERKRGGSGERNDSRAGLREGEHTKKDEHINIRRAHKR